MLRPASLQACVLVRGLREGYLRSFFHRTAASGRRPESIAAFSAEVSLWVILWATWGPHYPLTGCRFPLGCRGLAEHDSACVFLTLDYWDHRGFDQQTLSFMDTSDFSSGCQDASADVVMNPQKPPVPPSQLLSSSALSSYSRCSTMRDETPRVCRGCHEPGACR
eukprot:3595992-Prymnesium_polylepis.2